MHSSFLAKLNDSWNGFPINVSILNDIRAVCWVTDIKSTKCSHPQHKDPPIVTNPGKSIKKETKQPYQFNNFILKKKDNKKVPDKINIIIRST